MANGLRILESDWQRKVIETAKLFRWRYAHFRPAQTSKGWRTAMQGDKGFPDLVLCRPPRVIFAELKSEDGKVAGDQALWLQALAQSGVEVYTWRPKDFEAVFLCLAKDRL